MPLPEDPVARVKTEEQKKDNSDNDEGGESLKSQELSWQIDSHVVVLDDKQPRTGVSVSE